MKRGFDRPFERQGAKVLEPNPEQDRVATRISMGLTWLLGFLAFQAVDRSNAKP